jgi:hypothetical protein
MPLIFCSDGKSLADTDSIVRTKGFQCLSMLPPDKIMMFAEGAGAVETKLKTCIPEECGWILGSETDSCYWFFCFPQSLQKSYGKNPFHFISKYIIRHFTIFETYIIFN